MVLINNSTNIKIYYLDTKKSILERISTKLKTTPKYLYFTNGIPDINVFSNIENIEIENLLEDIIKYKNYNFLSLYESIKDKLNQNNLDVYNDVLLPFLAFNKQINTSENRNMYMLFLQTNINKSNIFSDDNINIENIWYNNSEKVREEINKNIQKVKENSKHQNNFLKQYENIKDNIHYTPFETEKISFKFNLMLSHITLLEIFNNVKLNTKVPFACVNNIYKLLKDFVPPEEWNIYLQDIIIFKVLQKIDVSNSQPVDYTDALLAISGEPGNEKISIGTSLETSGQYLDKEQLIDRISNTISEKTGTIDVSSVEENRINGVFYFPNFSINKYILADMILNNPVFSSVLSIDESDKIIKKKESVYVYFYHPKIGNVRANITEKISQKGDPNLRGKDIKEEFKFGSVFLRVRITMSDNIQSIIEFQKILSKLLVMYNEEKEDILAEYQYFIPNFKKKDNTEQLQKIEKLRIKDIAPEVFVRGYPPKCPNPPTIIEDNEVDDAVREGKKVMVYPKSKNEGFPQRNYICEYNNTPYPGLRENPLSNKDTVPYLPCCYIKDHSQIQGSIYRHYYYDEILKTKMDMEQQDFIITNKFVSKDKYGTLPDDIIKLFNIFDYDEKYMYVRKGVYDTKSSFLECVMEGMYEETNILSYESEKSRGKYLKKIRQKLGKQKYASLCRQEMYDYTNEKIIEMIKDEDVYLNPSLFISLLEEYFQCNIFVFNRVGLKFGEILVPRHLQAYYKNKNNYRKTIFIYEHIGSTSNNATYPRCELIVKWLVKSQKQEDVFYYSKSNSAVSKGIKNVFNRITKSYLFSMELPQVDFPLKSDDIELVEQGIDSYGKSSMIRFNFMNELGTLLISPIQPLALKEVKGWIITKITKENALKFISLNRIKITRQMVDNNDILKEIQGVLGNVNISIPVYDSSYIPNINKDNNGITYPTSKISVLEQYNQYKKLSRYFIEYFLWFFSLYIMEKNTQDMSLEIIKDFVDQKTVIIPDFKYNNNNNISKIFNVENNGITKNGKLVLKSMDTLKRLVYNLRVYIKRFPDKVISYHNRRVVENYYKDITDFDKYQNQIILQGDNSIKKWIQEQKIKYNIKNTIQENQKYPYFFQNDNISFNIYLAQNTDNIQKAIYIIQTWNGDNYNTGVDNIEESNYEGIILDDYNYILYNYISPSKIIKEKTSNNKQKYSMQIISYQIEDETYYTALLRI